MEQVSKYFYIIKIFNKYIDDQNVYVNMLANLTL